MAPPKGQFWNTPSIEPKRQHRWALHVGSLHIYLQKTDKPSLEIGETEHKYFGHSFFFPGHLTWQPLSVTFVDPFGDAGTTGKLTQWLSHAGYTEPGAVGGEGLPQTISKSNAMKTLGGYINLRQYKTGDNGVAEVGETWRLANAWFQKINYGSLDYTSDAMVTVDATIRYDYAVNTQN